jgi:hypothetical protein
MKKRKIKSALALACSLLMLISWPASLVMAQDSSADPMLRLYVDPATHIVYTEPGRGRRLLATIPSSALTGGAASSTSIEQRQARDEQELQENRAQMTELLQKNDQLEAQNEHFQTQMGAPGEAWERRMDNLKPFVRTQRVISPARTRLASQPEASLAWRWGNPPCEA